jgi:hypothetical protein
MAPSAISLLVISNSPLAVFIDRKIDFERALKFILGRVGTKLDPN